MAGIFEIIDSFVINHDNISKGFGTITKGYKYLLAKDKDGEVICFVLDTDGGQSRVLIQKYLENVGLKESFIKFENEHMKGSCERYKELYPKKLCVLDKELLLYKDVEERAKTQDIKKFTGKIPKHGFNVYKKN